MQFIKQQQGKSSKNTQLRVIVSDAVIFPYHLEFKLLSPINTRSIFSVRMTKD